MALTIRGKLFDSSFNQSEAVASRPTFYLVPRTEAPAITHQSVTDLDDALRPWLVRPLRAAARAWGGALSRPGRPRAAARGTSAGRWLYGWFAA